ncbi:MAG: transposase [Acidobacteriota bacterium]|nr:transposase [Acidobacteriota bacterium]
MARVARVMIEGLPFHLTHRGNHKIDVFTCDQDRIVYLKILRRYAERFGMNVWAYCLMSNHVHLIAVGQTKESISKALGNTQREHSRRKNEIQDVTGHLWANRFFSTALDDVHLWAAVRYVELNPVRAGVVSEATEYPWSSAGSHARLTTDPILATDRPFPGPIRDWRAWLRIGLEGPTAELLRRNTRRGVPTGAPSFVERLSNLS